MIEKFVCDITVPFSRNLVLMDQLLFQYSQCLSQTRVYNILLASSSSLCGTFLSLLFPLFNQLVIVVAIHPHVSREKLDL